MAKKFYCARCKKMIEKNELYIPSGMEGHKYHMCKLCKDCFEYVLNEAFNGGKNVNGIKK